MKIVMPALSLLVISGVVIFLAVPSIAEAISLPLIPFLSY